MGGRSSSPIIKANNTILLYYRPYAAWNGLQPVPFDVITNLKTSKSKTKVDHMAIGSIHCHNNCIWVNDNKCSDSVWSTVKEDINTLKNNGIFVTTQITAYYKDGTWNNLLGPEMDKYIQLLVNYIVDWGFQGINLDCEDRNITGWNEKIDTLITKTRQYSELGESFPVTMAPVASALAGTAGMTDLDYKSLKSNINWYNGQFYNGWGSLESISDYESIVKNGFDPLKVVAGIDSVALIEGEYDFNKIIDSVNTLSNKIYPNSFGGVFLWQSNSSLTLDLSQSYNSPENSAKMEKIRENTTNWVNKMYEAMNG